MLETPLDIPEIRNRVALYVSVKDALSCVRVSKAFSQDFAYRIWYTVDFQIHKTFVNLDEAILSKYGHHIRVVEDINSQGHLDSLLCLKVSKISVLRIKYIDDALYHASWNDLVRQNQTTLDKLDIRWESTKPLPTFIFLDCLTSMTYLPNSSNLTVLILRCLTLTRNSLTSVLRCCHNLKDIDLCYTTLILSRNLDDYQHTGVTMLMVSILHAIKDGNPPLLSHFPNLNRWKTSSNMKVSEFPTQKVNDCVSKWCPKLKVIETNATLGPLITHFISKVFIGISGLTFGYQQLSSDLILTLLRYPTNWISLVTYVPRIGFYEELREHGVSEIQDHFQDSGWMLQSLLRNCQNLEVFNFTGHEMDMDEIEEVPWACKNLRELQVRIKGLDTRDKVEGAIAKWRRGRTQRVAGAATQVVGDDDHSIEARTVRHLLRFHKLKAVWLGCKYWCL